MIEQNNAQSRGSTVPFADEIVYASQYATSPNTAMYEYFSGADCANFASQILEAGWQGQNVTSSKYSGWWHKCTLGIHTYSRSWTAADYFARYWGVSYETDNHADFSSHLSTGCFIAMDIGNDGDWDHIGYITNVYGSIGSYGYYNYRVAQHSSNYHEWATSPTNSWDAAEGTVKYGVIIRQKIFWMVL